jgi:hypothetical protein
MFRQSSSKGRIEPIDVRGHKAILLCVSNENNVIMVPFKYGDFYDVPRLIVLKYKGRIIMLGSYFDEKKDEYEDSYSIYLLPSSTNVEVSKSLYEGDVDAKLIGSVSIKSVVFDTTKRNALNPEFLDKYLAGE